MNARMYALIWMQGAMNVWMYAPVLGDSTSNGRDTEIPENLVEIPRWDLVMKTR